MINSFSENMQSCLSYDSVNNFVIYFDTTQVPYKNIQPMHLKLVKGGLTEDLTGSRPEKIISELSLQPPKSSARALLKFAGTWAGDDLKTCLEEVYNTRGDVEF